VIGLDGGDDSYYGYHDWADEPGPSVAVLRRRRRRAVSVLIAGLTLLAATAGAIATRRVWVPRLGSAAAAREAPPAPSESAEPSASTTPSPTPTPSVAASESALPVPQPTRTTSTTRPPNPPSPTPTQSTPAPPARCHSADLTVAWGAATNPTPETVSRPLVFTNRALAPCQLLGFPGLALIDITDVTVVRTTDAPGAVLLQPGQTATAVLTWTTAAGTYTGAACTPGATGITVTPPDESTALIVQGAITVCGTGVITTTPLR